MIYILTFILTILLVYIAEKYEKNKFVFIGLSFISMMPLILIGGLRDLSIGIDTEAYPVSAYYIANEIQHSYDIFTLDTNIEHLYLFMSYYACLIFGDSINSILIATQLIIIVCVYAGSYNLRSLCPMWLSILLFCLLDYNISIYLSRQAIATSLFFLGFSYFIICKYKHTLICFILASLFHKSALIIFPLLLTLNFKNIKYNIIFIFVVSISVLFFKNYINLLVSFSDFAKYSIYADNTYSGAFSNSEFLIRMSFIIFLLILTPSRKRNTYFYNIFTIFICELLLNLMQLYSLSLGRLCLYYYMLYIIYLPYYILKDINGNLHKIRTPAIVIFLMLSWLFVYINNRTGYTYPYSSMVLGISD